MAQAYEDPTIPKIGQTIHLDTSHTSLGNLLKGLKKFGLSFNLDQKFIVKDINPNEIRLKAKGKDFEISISFQQYARAARTLQ